MAEEAHVAATDWESAITAAENNPWTTLERDYAYQSPYIKVRHDSVVAPDGAYHSYEFVELPRDFSTVVAVDNTQQVYLVRQWRYPWQESSWEIPAGGMERGETPLACAQRELLEEVGLNASQWTPLGVFRTSASMTVRGHVYLAQELTASSANREGSESDMIVRTVPLESALEAVAAGRIAHALSSTGLFLAQRWLSRQATMIDR